MRSPPQCLRCLMPCCQALRRRSGLPNKWPTASQRRMSVQIVVVAADPESVPTNRPYPNQGLINWGSVSALAGPVSVVSTAVRRGDNCNSAICNSAICTILRGDLTRACLCRPIPCRFATISFPREGNLGKACQTVCAVALLPGPQPTATATTAMQQQSRCSGEDEKHDHAVALSGCIFFCVEQSSCDLRAQQSHRAAVASRRCDTRGDFPVARD